MFDRKTRKFSPFEVALGPGLILNPGALAFDPAGNLVVADPVANCLMCFRVEEPGRGTLLWELSTFFLIREACVLESELNGLCSFCFDSNGKLYVYDRGDIEDGKIMPRARPRVLTFVF